MLDFSKFYKNAWYSITEKFLFFYSHFNSYKNYWFVEYDVAYTGDNWTNLLDCIDQEFEKFDLITSGDYWVPSPDWFAYDSFEGFTAQRKDMIASFIFMSRISNNLFSKCLNPKISSLDTANCTFLFLLRLTVLQLPLYPQNIHHQYGHLI